MASAVQQLDISRAKLEQETADKQAFIEKTFEAGKILGEKGRWLEAAYEWEKMLPFVDEKSELKPALDAVKKDWQLLQEKKTSNDTFISTRYNKLDMPFMVDLEKTLVQLDSELRTSIEKAAADRQAMEKSLAEREPWLNTTYEKGKAYYEAGKVSEALDIWSALSPNLKGEKVLQSLLNDLPARFQSLADAKKAAAEAEKASKEPLPPPAGFAVLLAEFTQTPDAQTLETMSRAATSA